MERDIGHAEVRVFVKTLSPEEALGRPKRRDFPIVEGRERVIEASLQGFRAHAFTDSPAEFHGTLDEIMELTLESKSNRALFVAVMNALLARLGYIKGVLHCRDDEPEKCAMQIAASIRSRWGDVRVGLIGLNPAIAEGLAQEFGGEKVRITDLNRDNIGKMRHGVEILDGRTEQEKLISHCSVVLITGTTLVNGTMDDILELVNRYNREFLIYGVTAAGACWMMGWPRMCPYGR